MANLDSIPRVGRSQGAVIFWGLISAFFATAFCYYFWKDHENGPETSKLRDQVLALQEQVESLGSQKDKLQADVSETEKTLKSREDFLHDKETKLAEEETRLESLGQKSANQIEQGQSQVAVVKKFDDTVRKLAKAEDTDVVLRGGRPVLRAPSSLFFAMGEATLKPEGKATLNQIAQALNGQLDNFELRLESFTDTNGETPKPAEVSGDHPPQADNAAPKPRYASSWDLTAARASALARYVHDQTSLPFQNIAAIGRGDFQPVVPNAKDGHARNRRIEITITPLPASFHPPDASHASSTASAAPLNPLEPPPDAPRPGKGD